MALLLTAIGVVLVFEGLVFALAPSRLETFLETLRQIPVETRRILGLGAMAAGVLLLWLARGLGLG
ncbi:MAG: DUF2065 domain-containing protein [Qingshengfaniella sp.]